MQPEQTQTLNPVPQLETKKQPRQRHFLAVFFLSFMWGMFGVDRFYLGKWGTGILKLITFGGFGLWTLIDFIIIMTGAMKDKQGRPMLQVAEYKKFAGRTILIFALVLGAVILVNGLLLIYGTYQLMTALQNGDLINLIPGLDQLPVDEIERLLPGGVLPDTELLQQIQDGQY
jgi:TM2 domain-containing membrane protein YozV